MGEREAIILAGGLGTRLKGVTGDRPKVMASVDGRPFLEYLLDYLIVNKITRTILATGYGGDALTEYFGSSYKGMPLVWSHENEPLGTGGAILQAIDLAGTDSVFVFNGDTLFNVPLDEMIMVLGNCNSVGLALKPMTNFDRYGVVELESGKIKHFAEKKKYIQGLINGGVYLLSREWLTGRAPGHKFSFEKDILEKYVSEGEMSAFICDEYFIDIGIPDDFKRAQIEIPLLFPPAT